MKANKEKYKITLIAILSATCCFLTYYFHEFQKTHVVITHLYYIPIVLASFWWGRKGLSVAGFLAAFLLFHNHFLTLVWRICQKLEYYNFWQVARGGDGLTVIMDFLQKSVVQIFSIKTPLILGRS